MEKIVIALLHAVVYSCYSIVYMHFMQLCGYKINRGYNRVLRLQYFWKVLALGVVYLIAYITFDVAKIAVAGFLILSVMLIPFVYARKTKTKYVRTNRIKRQTICNFLVFMLISYFYPPIPLLILPLIIAICFFINTPIEYAINRNYLIKSNKKLQSFPNIKRIVITGSYGKTTVKDFIYQIVKDKFNTLCTQKSFNTPLGVSKTINEGLNENTQLFIAEAGARKKGDIIQICKHMQVDIGVITGIAMQHMETFLTLENVINTKLELNDCIKKGGELLYNGDNEILTKSIIDRKIQGFSCGNNGKWLKIDSVGNGAIKLTVDNKTIIAKTTLIGKHNLSNIAMAVAVAYKLGIPLEYIASKIEHLKASPHRLEVIKSNGITIIDDTYNSNSFGAAAAIEALKELTGEKTIVTCGIVEGGKMQYELNYNLGKSIATIARYVYISGINTKALKNGLTDGGFKQQIVIADAKESALLMKKHLKYGDIVLFLNDLTDNYI